MHQPCVRSLEITTRPNISLGVIPVRTEPQAVASAGFWIFDDTLVALETPIAFIEVTQPQEIHLYKRLFDVLKNNALYGPDARGLIQEAAPSRP